MPRRHDGAVDGAWWPRTHQPAVELNALVECLERDLDPITRLSLCGTTWDGTPDHIRVGDRDVRLIWFALRDPHTVIVGYGADEITLLVIPQEVTPVSGARAMSMASDRTNTTDPAGILRASKAASRGRRIGSGTAAPVEPTAARSSPSGDPARAVTGRVGTGAGPRPAPS